jgi:hypothetical protein
MWTINDFSAFADLSRWPNRGANACPCRMQSTRSIWLKHGKKYWYMGHRRYFPMEHLWQLDKRTFDGTEELECAPDVQCGDKIFGQLDGMSFGDESTGKKKWKKRKKGAATNEDNVVWKKEKYFLQITILE